MSYIKLKNPVNGEDTSFEFGHAQRILKLQEKKSYPKSKCWTMTEKNPKGKTNDNKSGKSKSNTGEGTESESKKS